MKEIDPQQVANKYNKLDKIWDEKDRWHQWTRKKISDFIQKSLISIGDYSEFKILNAGSAGNSYGIDERNILHVDVAQNKIQHLDNSMAADIHDIPLGDKQFDLILCVGSVINYCDPIIVMSQFERLLKPNGYIILEFENSYTLELFGKKSFNKKATLVKTFNNGSTELLWFFSESYIRNLAKLSGCDVILKKRFHIISPLLYRISRNENFAAGFSRLDNIFYLIPLLNKFSSNTIFLLQKKR